MHIMYIDRVLDNVHQNDLNTITRYQSASNGKPPDHDIDSKLSDLDLINIGHKSVQR